MTAVATTAQPAASRRMLILALILGAVAAGLIVAFLASQQDSTVRPEAATTVEVVVATADIPAGTKVTDAMVTTRAISQSALVSGYLTNRTDVVDQTTRYPVAKGEQFASGRLVEPAGGRAISFQIPPGLRGFTVAVNDSSSPAALLAPGDFVDVIVTASVKNIIPPNGVVVPSNANVDYKAAVTLLQNVQVLSIQRDFLDNGVVYEKSTRGAPTDDENINNVTLAVTPEQAQLLWLASQEGKVTLSLRAFGDNDVADLAPIAEPVRIN